MSWGAAAWLMLGGSTVLLFLGLPVAFSFLVINLAGALLFLGGEAGLTQLARNSVVSVASFSLTPIPLFILMGEVLFHTGLAVKVIDGVERLVRQVPGRLAVVAVVAGTVFSAISGSTIATTAMLGSLMLPVMLSRGYHPTMATGPLMAIGAVEALKAANRKALVVGINASKEVIDFVKSGDILGSGDYNGFIQGCLGTQIAIRNLRKQPTPKEVSLKAVVMDKTNYRDYETPMEKRACPALDSIAGN